MGSGKSMIGRSLSQQLLVPFFDLDELIIEKEQLPIKEIFQKFGESYFRVLETNMIREVSETNDPAIIALGGGAFCSEKNQKMIQDSGISVFLDVSAPILVQRLMRNTKRPLLLNADGTMKSEEEISQIIESMMNKRRMWYENATVHLKIDQIMEKHEVCDFVYQQLKPLLT